ncbi:hypothetical protein B0T14DRAFT_491918 [Immersiella caudata]|uniref:Uncharacterized protein n=1 Tax=Immersiella caudata TaxID=314043 RepID=A0AA39XIP3_9PEZI|nr:hypothetical protein B0T14DRAFT_491918 [Immersiella caudata]
MDDYMEMVKALKGDERVEAVFVQEAKYKAKAMQATSAFLAGATDAPVAAATALGSVTMSNPGIAGSSTLPKERKLRKKEDAASEKPGTDPQWKNSVVPNDVFSQHPKAGLQETWQERRKEDQEREKAETDADLEDIHRFGSRTFKISMYSECKMSFITPGIYSSSQPESAPEPSDLARWTKDEEME